MLKSIEVENFKALNKIENLEIKPITILCGSNSSGKSSVLNSALLLKQSIESATNTNILSLNGKYIHLGTFENIIYKKNMDKKIKLQYTFAVNKREVRFINQTKSINIRLLQMILPKEIFSRITNGEVYFEYKYIIGINNIFEKPDSAVQYVDECSIKVYCDDSSIEPLHINCKVTNVNKKEYEVKYTNVLDDFFEEGNTKSEIIKNVNISFSKLDIRFYGSSIDKKNIDKISNLNLILSVLYGLLCAFTESFSYIGPLREEPNRRYVLENEVSEIGIKGENAAFLYYLKRDEKAELEYTLDEGKDRFVKTEKTDTLEQKLKHWLDIMGICNLKPENYNEIIQLMLDSEVSTRVNIADVGFGVSQIFPIVLQGLLMHQGETLLLEQPEIHLHPALQMKMADYFIAMALSGKNLIVETHSDHIINRLVRRIVEDEEYDLRKYIQIYFIESSNEGSKIKPIEISDTSGIVNWPEGFFDQNALEQEKIIMAGIKKRKSRR